MRFKTRLYRRGTFTNPIQNGHSNSKYPFLIFHYTLRKDNVGYINGSYIYKPIVIMLIKF